MNLKEAKAQLEELSYLIGSFQDGIEITHLGIVPTQKELTAEIVDYLLDEEDYQHLLIGFDDFQIIVYFDLYHFTDTGLLIWEYLDVVLKK